MRANTLGSAGGRLEGRHRLLRNRAGHMPSVRDGREGLLGLSTVRVGITGGGKLTDLLIVDYGYTNETYDADT